MLTASTKMPLMSLMNRLMARKAKLKWYPMSLAVPDSKTRRIWRSPWPRFQPTTADLAVSTSLFEGHQDHRHPGQASHLRVQAQDDVVVVCITDVLRNQVQVGVAANVVHGEEVVVVHAEMHADRVAHGELERLVPHRVERA